MIDALFNVHAEKTPLVTFFTSMFMHGSFLHLFFNMLFLWTFGENIERALGSPRFALYYLFWGLGAAVAHVFVLSYTSVPMVGASGAIGGVLGCYLLLFPAHRITIVIPPIFWPVSLFRLDSARPLVCLASVFPARRCGKLGARRRLRYGPVDGAHCRWPRTNFEG